jgi:hypothetical protein
MADIRTVRALSGVSFLGGVPITAGAGTFAEVQLYNPVASGKILLVYGLRLATSVAQQLIWGGLAELVGGASPAGSNKILGGAAPIALMRNKTPVAADALTSPQGTEQVQANLPITVALSAPIIVPAGLGLTVIASIAANNVTADFDWDEVAG